MTRDELYAISQETQVAAFLRALRLGEGTKDSLGYRRMVGGGEFASFADHPRIEVRLNAKLRSTAAGAYQFLSRTWDGLVKQYGFPSFEPKWQDAGAVGLLIGRKALGAIRTGRIAEAVALCNREWASLPGSPYGQRTETLDAFLGEFRRWGGVINGEPTPATPVDLPANTAETPAETPVDMPVDPQTQAQMPVDLPAMSGESPEYGAPPVPLPAILAAALPVLINHIPDLARMFGSGSEVAERNVKAATKALEVVQVAVGAVNAQEAAEKIANDPQAREQARSAVKAQWFEIVEAGGGGIDGARKADTARSEAGWVPWRSASFMVALLLFPVLYAISVSILFPATGGDWPADVRAAIVSGMVSSILGGLVGYYFGSMTGKAKP